MEFDEASKELLKNRNFQEYKKKQYILVKNDIVFYLNFLGRKKDIYIWYAIYPLCMPNIWFGCGWGQCAGRFPSKENEISISNETEIIETSNKLSDLLKNQYFVLFDKVNNLADIADLYLPSYLAGFSYLASGDFDKGISLLKEYKIFKEGLTESSVVEEEVEFFINNSDKNNIDPLLDIERQKNIKKLRLSKYIK